MHTPQCVGSVFTLGRAPLPKTQIEVAPGQSAFAFGQLGARSGVMVSGRGVIVRLVQADGRSVGVCVPDGGVCVVTSTLPMVEVQIDTLTTGTTTPAFVSWVDLASLAPYVPGESST